MSSKYSMTSTIWGWSKACSASGRNDTTWWLIPLSKWVITPVISGLTLLIPFITGVITHLLSGMSHQVEAQNIKIHHWQGKGALYSPVAVKVWKLSWKILPWAQAQNHHLHPSEEFPSPPWAPRSTMGQSMDQSINPWLPYRILSLQPWGYLYVCVGPPSFAQASCRTCWMLMAGTLWTFPKEPSPRTSLNSYSASIWNQKLMSWSHLKSITPVSSKVISWIHQPIWWGIKSMNQMLMHGDTFWTEIAPQSWSKKYGKNHQKPACRTFFLTRSCFVSWAQSLDRIYKPRFLQFDWGMVLISPFSIYFW